MALKLGAEHHIPTVRSGIANHPYSFSDVNSHIRQIESNVIESAICYGEFLCITIVEICHMAAVGATTIGKRVVFAAHREVEFSRIEQATVTVEFAGHFFGNFDGA